MIFVFCQFKPFIDICSVKNYEKKTHSRFCICILPQKSHPLYLNLSLNIHIVIDNNIIPFLLFLEHNVALLVVLLYKAINNMVHANVLKTSRKNSSSFCINKSNFLKLSPCLMLIFSF